MSKTITLPILKAFDYLYERGLTIDKLWVEDKIGSYPKLRRTRKTHVTTKPLKEIQTASRRAKK